MKKVVFIMLMGVISLLGVSNVSAASSEELDEKCVKIGENAYLSDGILGTGENEDIIFADGTSENGDKFYYKYVPIDEDKFNTYLKMITKLDMARAGDLSMTKTELDVLERQTLLLDDSIDALLPVAHSEEELKTWTEVVDRKLKFDNLRYANGKHYGYVLRIIVKHKDEGEPGKELLETSNSSYLESKSTTTLGEFDRLLYKQYYEEIEKKKQETNTSSSTSPKKENVTPTQTNISGVKTDANPSTGISDVAIYLVPASIIVGSVLIIRKRYC